MSKRKTVLKFSIAALLLGGSSTVAVLYFPYVALAIKFGIVISTAPLAIFAISVVAALASVITLAAFTISAIRNKGKPNGVDGESISKNEEKGESLVQEKEQAVPILTPPLLSQESEKSVIPIPQQPPVDDPVEETETPQPENVMVNGADQQANQTEESLPSLPPYTKQTSPLNILNQSRPFPSSPSIINLEDGSNSIKNCKERGYMSLPTRLPEQSQTSHNAKLALRLSYELNERKQQPNQVSTADSYGSWGSDFESSIISNNSPPSVSITQELAERPEGVSCSSELNNVHNILEYQRWLSLMNNCSNSYGSFMLSSIREPDRLQESLGSDNSSVQSFQPKKKLLYDVNKKNFDSVGYQVNSRLSEHAGKAPNCKWVFAPTETDVNSGPGAMSYEVNDNRTPDSSMQLPVLSSFANRSNSFSGQESF